MGVTDKYQNRYRIASTRLQDWDYSRDAAYFITICTKNRECCFGKIINDKMELSHLGILADVFWHEIKNHAKNVELGAFQVMPNHIHGILWLVGNGDYNYERYIGERNDGCADGGDTTAVGDADGVGETDVETRHALSLPKTPGQSRFQNQGKNTVSSIIGSYKSSVSKHAHRLGFEFEWQSRFHDHIIRDDASYNRIETYIINNPTNWKGDKFYI